MWFLLWQLFCVRVVLFLWDVGRKLTNPTVPRRDYVIKNLAKSCTLALLTPVAVDTAAAVLSAEHWHAHRFRFFGAVYAAHDIAGLLRMWHKLPNSTRAHHLSVVLMSTLSAVAIDYEDPSSLWRGVGMLGCVSCWTFPVNTYVALRLVGNYDTLRKLCLCVYAPTVLLSFLWQLRHVLTAGLWCWSAPVYVALVGSVIYDDLVLLRFLRRKSTPSAPGPDCQTFHRLWDGMPAPADAFEADDAPAETADAEHRRPFEFAAVYAGDEQ
ncbi:MAG: hypothetical protein CL450_08810 [Acidimicrobiaceae bacterium]|jgi:hypothetical protein|nr:hypothetical protein [Acidimicrobiaceae bacterium]|tara:strand:+ start:110 stop:913 length:804 start_codon:yes stop_codon:yes gene_type:complete